MLIKVNEFDLYVKIGPLCYYVSVFPECQCNLLEGYPYITSYSNSADILEWLGGMVIDLMTTLTKTFT